MKLSLNLFANALKAALRNAMKNYDYLGIQETRNGTK